MQAVKIKNINKSHMKKSFVVKGRIKYLNVENNRNSSGSHLNAIVFDDSSEIEVVAFKNCGNISKLLKVNNVVMIEYGILREVNKDYKKTKHKYQILLESCSIITIINNNDVNDDEFPVHKYTSGAELKNLTTGMIIDVIGFCVQIDREKLMNTQNQIIRKAKMVVDSTLIDVSFCDDKADNPYDVGSTLFMSNVKYINFKGYIHLSVGNSSLVKINPQQLSNGIDMEQLHLQQLEKVKQFCQVFNIEFPESKLSTSSITQPNKKSTIELPEEILSPLWSTQPNKKSTIELPEQKFSPSWWTQPNKKSTIELPEQRFWTSCTTQSYKISDLVDESVNQKLSTSGPKRPKKRKTQDFKGKEVTSKILRTAEPEVSFSDERFVDMVINFMQTVNNNKNVIQLRILEFISRIVKENEN